MRDNNPLSVKNGGSSSIPAFSVTPALTQLEAVVIDTSGYGSDCNFSDLLPQHAMKPYRVMATMELIRALGVVDRVNRLQTEKLLVQRAAAAAEEAEKQSKKKAGSSGTSATTTPSRPRRPHLTMPRKRPRSRSRAAITVTTTVPAAAESPSSPSSASSTTTNAAAGAAGVTPPVDAPPPHYHSCRVVVPPLLSIRDLERVHALTYLGNLGVHSTGCWKWSPASSKAFFSVDCPPVEGIMEHSIATASGTLMGAVLLNTRRTRVAIHWGGGMHHAKCGECSGFCYISDIILGIVELLKAHQRVLYIDLDVHHGDGVDEAFCHSNRVFTLSLHKFGDSFFPGTGHPRDCGYGEGKEFTMNLALWDGINDFFYTSIFSFALRTVCSTFRPEAIVLQCGADSLAGDRLGTFNLSSWGHGECVRLVRETGLPVLAVGGGGYTIRSVAKLWAYETSILCGAPLPLSTPIPVESMPLTGWLFEYDQPSLLVPADASVRCTAGWSVQRGYRAAMEQIENAGQRLKVVTEAWTRGEEQAPSSTTSLPPPPVAAEREEDAEESSSCTDALPAAVKQELDEEGEAVPLPSSVTPAVADAAASMKDDEKELSNSYQEREDEEKAILDAPDELPSSLLTTVLPPSVTEGEEKRDGEDELASERVSE